MITRIFKEPLFHFILIGILLFVLNSLFEKNESDNVIIIDKYDINEIVSKYQMQWNREPDERELKGLVDAYVKEEILYREALAMNLDHNDEIIRRRMAQKMKFLTEDMLSNFNPTEEQLDEFYQTNSNKYRMDKKISFEQIYYNPTKRKDPISEAISDIENQNAMGDPISIEKVFENADLFTIRRKLGKSFVIGIDSLNVDKEKWQGPIVSGMGFHLVRISSIQEGMLPPLSKVKEKVTNDFNYEYQEKMNRELMDGLIEKYEIVFQFDSSE